MQGPTPEVVAGSRAPDVAAQLRALEWAATVPDSALERLADEGILVRIGPRRPLRRRLEPVRTSAIVLAGELLVLHEHRVTARLGVGEVVGQTDPHTSIVTAALDAVVLIVPTHVLTQVQRQREQV